MLGRILALPFALSAMFCTVTFVVFLFGVLDPTWGEELSDENVTDETLAKQWIPDVKANILKLLYEEREGKWNYNTDIKEETKTLWREARGRYGQYAEWACKNASCFNWKNFTDQNLTEWFKFIESECPSTKEVDFSERELGEVVSNMTTIYNTAEICKEDNDIASGNGSCFAENPGLINLMATSRNWSELLWAWKGWRDVTGKKMRTLYAKNVFLLNNLTKCRDFGECWQNRFGIKNFASACEELWQQVKPLYQQLHAYVRRKLMDSYPDNLKDFPSTRQIPAHILGNIWAQQWGNIYGLVEPFPNSSVVNVTKVLIDQGYNVHRMFREAEAFFTSLGLPAMTQEFWNRSLFEKPKDEQRKVECSPSSHNFYNKRDFRIKMCTEVTEFFFQLTHHEMGHIQYYMNYKDLPLLEQSAPSPAFGEAVGDVIALSVMTPEHLRKINLINSTTDDHEIQSEINFLMKIALEKVAYLPYGYLVDKWRWEIANRSIYPEKYNKKYWKLRCGMQGISPPVNRFEEDFDPGAKIHVADNYPFISYFVSGIIQFQFHRGLCEAAGHVGPLHKCDIYKSKAAGDKLRKMLSLGKTKPWEDAMEIMTGHRNVSAEPLLEYFRPLQKWLKEQNAGQDVGWDADCPSGLIQ